MNRKQEQANDSEQMSLALKLAKRGQGLVSPNPMVGCVIATPEKILAQGWHKKFGGDHAEVVALKKLARKKIPRTHRNNATLYVTLEPCAHFGKTPPCVDAVIASGIKRVVVAMPDPNPLTAGKSIRKMRRAGIEVVVGMAEAEARELNKFFIKYITTGMPYVIAKVAQSLDGKITAQKGKQTWLTGDLARTYVHTLRAGVDAVLVGKNTVLIDNPKLTVRIPCKKQPLRVVVDSGLEVLKSYYSGLLKGIHLLDSDFRECAASPWEACHSGQRAGIPLHNLLLPLQSASVDPGSTLRHSVPLCARDDEKRGKVIWVTRLSPDHPYVFRFSQAGHDIICVPGKGKIVLKQLFKQLGKMGVASVLCEGGGEIFRSLIRQNLADEWQILVAPRIVGNGGVTGFPLKKIREFSHLDVKSVGDDCLIIGR